MSNLHETADPAEAAVRAVNTTVGDDELLESTIVLTAVHVPGTPLERVEDARSSREFENDLREVGSDTHRNVPVETIEGIDTRTPEGNLATRSNIVRSAASA